MVEHLPDVIKVLSSIPSTITTQTGSEGKEGDIQTEEEVIHSANIQKRPTRPVFNHSDLHEQNKESSQANSRLC